MVSAHTQGIYKLPLRSGSLALVLFFLFTCLHVVLTLLLADSFQLAFLSYLVGLLALVVVLRFGGLTTVVGFLVALFVARYYFVPLAVKAIEGRPIWHNLQSPFETFLVMICSLLAMVVVSLFLGEKKFTNESGLTLSDLKDSRRLVVMTTVIGIVAALLTAARAQRGTETEVSTGFLAGAGSLLEIFLPFSLALAIYVALIQNRNVVRSPTVVLLFAINVPYAFTDLSRASVLNLLLAIVIPYLFAKQRVPARVVVSMFVALLLFIFVINPAILYARSPHLGKVAYYSIEERVESTSRFWVNTVTNPESLTKYNEAISKSPFYLRYFENHYGGLERFAILPDNDALIAGTKAKGYGGWRTITWAISMVPPRFIYPEKPLVGPGAYLGGVAGLRAPLDTETQWALGFTSEFYHAFSYVGVFIGTIGVLCLMFLAIKLLDLVGVMAQWKMLLMLSYWNAFSESFLAGILYSLIPLVVFIILADRIVRYSRRWQFATK